MTTQRYNIFYRIHKGLRAMLYETALKIQHTDFWNIEEAEETIERIRDVVKVFDKHANTEDSLVFPALEKYDPAASDAFEQEHVKDHLLGNMLTEAIERCSNAAIINEKAEASTEVQIAFVKFMVFNLEHMAKEEDLINKILWRHYSDAELMAITRQIVASLPPEHASEGFKWMSRGLNNPEITRWLKEVERNAPEPAFRGLFAVAEKELPQKRFHPV